MILDLILGFLIPKLRKHFAEFLIIISFITLECSSRTLVLDLVQSITQSSFSVRFLNKRLIWVYFDTRPKGRYSKFIPIEFYFHFILRDWLLNGMFIIYPQNLVLSVKIFFYIFFSYSYLHHCFWFLFLFFTKYI